jgi:hypothetical protein
MNYLKIIYGWWLSHGTRLIGIAQGTIAAIAGVSGVIPDGHLKYWLGASAVLTFWRGQTNSRTVDDGSQSGV